MRQFILLSAFVFLGGTSAAIGAPAAVVRTPHAKTASIGGPCQQAGVILTQPREAPRSDKLGELPPGNVLLTVVREEDGCQKPVIVRYGVGSNSAPATRAERLRRPLRP